jgi:hypothetical protein
LASCLQIKFDDLLKELLRSFNHLSLICKELKKIWDIYFRFGCPREEPFNYDRLLDFLNSKIRGFRDPYPEHVLIYMLAKEEIFPSGNPVSSNQEIIDFIKRLAPPGQNNLSIVEILQKRYESQRESFILTDKRDPKGDIISLRLYRKFLMDFDPQNFNLRTFEHPLEIELMERIYKLFKPIQDLVENEPNENLYQFEPYKTYFTKGLVISDEAITLSGKYIKRHFSELESELIKQILSSPPGSPDLKALKWRLHGYDEIRRNFLFYLW